MHSVLRLPLRKSIRRPAILLLMLVWLLVMAVTASSAAVPVRQIASSTSSSPDLNWSLWPEWSLYTVPDLDMYNSSFSQIPRDVTGERTRQWQCQIGDELHHGGPRWQVVAANALAGPPGTPDDIEDELQAAGDADAAEYPLLHKRDAQEAAWYAQLNSISGAYGVTPSFGYPTDAFLWESIHFSRTQPHAPLASAATVSRIRDMITAGIATDAFLQAYTAYWDSITRRRGAPRSPRLRSQRSTRSCRTSRPVSAHRSASRIRR